MKPKRAHAAAYATILLAVVACRPYGKADLAEEAREREQHCSDHCAEGTCDNLGHGTSLHDVPCTPNFAARVGEKCSKTINCARGLHCTDDGWRGHCAAPDP